MGVKFGLYKRFLVVEYSETDVRAYRSRHYYSGNLPSYEAASRTAIDQVIDEAEDMGDFTDAEYYDMMQLLGSPALRSTKAAVHGSYASKLELEREGDDLAITFYDEIGEWKSRVVYRGKDVEDAVHSLGPW